MNSLQITKGLMALNNIQAKKRYGQNFLIDDFVLNEIVENSNISSGDVVLEIGPGLGNLSEYILNKKVKLYAYEVDEQMVEILNKRFMKNENFEVRLQDILKSNLNETLEQVVSKTNKKVKVIANLPYYITTPIIFKLFESKEYIDTITIMVQREVAERIVALPSNKEYGVLTVMLNAYSTPKLLFNVEPSSFIPSPNVTSSVLLLKIEENKYAIEDDKIFRNVVKSSFSSRRKKLCNSFMNQNTMGINKEQFEEALLIINKNENVRAEELSVEEYVSLANSINNCIKKNS